jgi:hypothetical protein
MTANRFRFVSLWQATSIVILYHQYVAMTEKTLSTLKTVCGAIHYALTTYNRAEIPDRDWEYLSSSLELDRNTIYGIELTGSGFFFWSKHVSFRYRGSQFHHQRQIEIKDFPT